MLARCHGMAGGALSEELRAALRIACRERERSCEMQHHCYGDSCAHLSALIALDTPAQQRDDVGRIPFHRAEMAADLAAVAVDEQRRGQAGGVHLERGLRRAVDV